MMNKYIQSSLAFMNRMLASTMPILIFSCIGLAIFSWLLYVQVWQLYTNNLPSTSTSMLQKPFAVEKLQLIDAYIQSKRQHQVRNYQQYQQLFKQ